MLPDAYIAGTEFASTTASVDRVRARMVCKGVRAAARMVGSQCCRAPRIGGTALAFTAVFVDRGSASK